MAPKPSLFGKWILLLLVCLPLAGCGFDPADRVYSDTAPPDVQSPDGVWWMPILVKGTDTEWQYVPEKALIASGLRVAKPGYQLDVILPDGKVFRLIKAADGYEFGGIIDQDPAANPGLQFFATILFFALVICIIIAVALSRSLHSSGNALVEVHAQVAAAKAEARRHEATLRDTLANVEADRQRSEKQRASEEQALKATREELERQQKVLALAATAPKLTIETLTKENYLTMSHAIRRQLFNGHAASREVTVNWAIDPYMSDGLAWACAFEWQNLIERPTTHRLTVVRDGTVIHQEAGSFRGTFGSLLHVGKRHKFTWSVYDGDREFPDPLLIEVVAPPFEACMTMPPEPKTADELRRERDIWIRDQYQLIDEKIHDPELRKAKKAQIDQEAVTKFGEAP